MALNLSELSNAVNAALDNAAKRHESLSYKHVLTASDVADDCPRRAWLKFRWMYEDLPTKERIVSLHQSAKMQKVVITMLREAGVEVDTFASSEGDLFFNETNAEFDILQSTDVANIDQSYVSDDANYIGLADKLDFVLPRHGFKKAHNHFVGKIEGLVSLPKTNFKVGLKIKSTSDNSTFNKLVRNGVRCEKKTHWREMCLTAVEMDLDTVLYICINKNSNQFHVEFLEIDEDEGLRLSKLGENIIASDKAPERISDNPSFYKCANCSAKKVCFLQEPSPKNCKTCIFAKPVEQGNWFCDVYKQNIPRNFLFMGCDEYKPRGI